jgi:hypothetical protein
MGNGMGTFDYFGFLTDVRRLEECKTGWESVAGGRVATEAVVLAVHQARGSSSRSYPGYFQGSKFRDDDVQAVTFRLQLRLESPSNAPRKVHTYQRIPKGEVERLRVNSRLTVYLKPLRWWQAVLPHPRIFINWPERHDPPDNPSPKSVSTRLKRLMHRFSRRSHKKKI